MGILALVLGVACTFSASAQAAVDDSSAMTERAADCTTEAKLERGAPAVVRYIVWCGVQPGKVTLRIRRPRGSAVLGFSRVAQASGPGAAGSLHCRSQQGMRVFCVGRKSGPVTFRGTVTVARGTRCSALLSLNVWRWTGDLMDFPAGCPKGYEPPVRTVKQIVEDRAYEGLDLDLAGDRAAIVRRAMSLLQAWRQGDPVARWTYEEEAWGMPLRAAEQAELEYRDTYREHFQRLVEDGDWVARNAPGSWAGYGLDDAAGGIIYVGFTTEPEVMLEKLKRRLIAPERFRPFPVTPTHTEAELEEIWFSFPPRNSPLSNLVNMTSIDYLANKVEVGTQYVARVRRLIAKRYGPDAPFEVVFAQPIELVTGTPPVSSTAGL